MIKAGTGISNNQDAFEAGKQAALQAKEEMKGINPQLIFVSASSPYDQEKVLNGIDSVFPDIPLTGGSPFGGVISHKGIEDQGVIVTVLTFEKTKFAITCVEDIFFNKDLAQKGFDLGDQLFKKYQEPPKLIILFLSHVEKDGQMVCIDLVLEGLKKRLKESSIIGTATVDEELLKTGKVASGFEYYNKTVKQHSAVAVGFWGDFSFSIEAKHGWEPIGLEMEVTKAKGTFVQEIDGKPAIEVFEKYLKKTKEEILAPDFFAGGGGFMYPFGIILKDPERVIVRQVAGATANGELITENLPKGSIIRLMQALPEKIPQVAEQTAKNALSELGKIPQVAFLFSCGTRKLFLIPDQKKESEKIISVIGKDVPLFGLWAGGEMCSSKEEKDWLVYNETITLGLMSE